MYVSLSRFKNLVINAPMVPYAKSSRRHVVLRITSYPFFFLVFQYGEHDRARSCYVRTSTLRLTLAINNANANRTTRSAYEDIDVRRYNEENRDTRADRSYGDECQRTSTRTLSMASSAATLRSQVILFASFRSRQLM